MKVRIVFRADGSSEIGLGHVIRSLALAQMLEAEFECLFAMQEPSEALQQQIRLICSEIYHLPLCTEESDALIHEMDAYLTGTEIVVLDGYKFSTLYQEHLKNKGCAVVCIDDIHSHHFVADAVINHAVGFDVKSYSAEYYTQFFFGPSYALLREEFLHASKERSVDFLRNEVLITLGGADPANHTLQVIESINRNCLYKEYKLNVVIGAAYRYQQELFNYINTNNLDIHVHNAIGAKQMVELMKRAKIAICSPSTVTFEYLSVSEGRLYLVHIAENQKEFYTYLISKKIALDFFKCFDDNTIDLPGVRSIKHILDGNQQLRYLKIFSNIR